MRKNLTHLSCSLLVATVLVVLLSPTSPQADASPGSLGYSTEVSVSPSPKTEGAFLCKAVVKDLATGSIAAAPALLAAAGEQGEAESSQDGKKLRFVVKVDPTASTASYSIVLTDGGGDTMLHKGSVQLVKG